MTATPRNAGRIIRFLGLIGAGLFAAWCLYLLRADLAHLPLDSLLRSWKAVLAAATMSLMGYTLRAVRWRWYLHWLGHSLPHGFSLLTYVAGFAFTLSPGKLGELVRARYYVRIGIPFRDIAAAIFVERLMDLIALVAMASLMIAAFPRYRAVVWTAVGILAAALTLLLLMPTGKVRAAVRSARLPAVVSRAVAEVRGAFENARALLRLPAILIGLALAASAWSLEGLGLGVLSSVVPGAPIEPLLAVGVYAFALLVGALSFLPGGLGSTEAAMGALLVANGHSFADALLITLTCRLVTLWLAVCLGWIAVAALRCRRAQ